MSRASGQREPYMPTGPVTVNRNLPPVGPPSRSASTSSHGSQLLSRATLADLVRLERAQAPEVLARLRGLLPLAISVEHDLASGCEPLFGVVDHGAELGILSG